MLSLFDTGKIQQENASILNLGALCGLTPPFSLKDFMLKDCLVDTQAFKIGIALISWSPSFPNSPQAPNPSHNVDWYKDFFLNWRSQNSVANFWYKQSFGRIKIEGQVLKWNFLRAKEEDIFAGDANNRVLLRQTARSLVDQLAADNGGFPDDYDAFIGVFNLPAGYRLDGGSSGNFSSFAIGDSFAFHTHEVGHLIGGKFNFHHSFGKENSEYCTGMYGHPYCVMSAQRYGNSNVILNSPATFPTKEENSRGPGLSGATRFNLGWASGAQFDLRNEQEAFFNLRSLGSNQAGIQVVNITDGERTFFVEYRASKDYNDQGISNLEYDATVVISALAGGIATILAQNCATFLGEIPLKFKSGLVPETIVNVNPFWGVKVISFDEKNSRVEIRILKNPVFSLRTYRRTNHILLASDEVDSWEIVNIVGPENVEKAARACSDYNRINSWKVNGNTVRNLRSLI